MTRAVLMEATPRDPGVGLVTVRASTALKNESAVLDTGGGLWLPAITREPRYTIDIFGSELTGQLRVDYGVLGLRFAPALGNDIWSRYIWDGAPLKLWRGVAGAPLASYTPIFDGRAGPIERGSANSGTLQLRGPEADLDKPLLRATYAGTGGAEGNVAMRGVLKPWCSGPAEGVPGILVDKTHWVWQLHGYGAIDAVTAAYEGGIAKGAAAADVASFAALIGLALGVGQWATCRAAGLVRFGGEPRMRVSFDVRGAMDGAAFPARAGAIAAHLIRTAGVLPARVSTASAAALDAAFPFDWNAFVTAQVTVGEMVRKAMADLAGYAFPDGGGVWRFGRWRFGKSPTLLSHARDQLPLVQTIRQDAAASPAGEVTVAARRCWGVHAETDISPALIEALAAARADIDGVLLNLGRIGADDWLHPGEKLLIVKEKLAIDHRVTQLRARMVALSLPVAALDADMAALNAYLSGLSPAWNSTVAATAIVRANWNGAWGNAYDEIEKGEIAVSQEDARRATWSGVDGAGRPSDNATRNVPRGTYASATAYVRGDLVVEAGSTYQLIVDSATGFAPPDAARWILVAAAGTGPTGAAGADGFSVIVSNEAHVVATNTDGSGGSYTSAGGQMQVFRGTTLQSPVFSIPARTPNTAWITISAAGVYTVTDPGVDLATATLRANVGGIDFDRTYTLAKSKQGINGPAVQLTADRQGFVFTDNVADPASQTITLTAAIAGVAGTPVFSSSPAVALAGTGASRTLAIADFGAHRQVTVTVTVGGLSDRITLVRVDRSTAAAGATVGAPGGTMVGGIPVEIAQAMTPAGMLETFAPHPDLASVERAWTLGEAGSTLLSLAEVNMSGGAGLRFTGIKNFIGRHRVAYAAEDLYRISARIHISQTAAGLTHMLGVAGYATSGALIAPLDSGTYSYAGGIYANLPVGFHEIEGYFRGRAAVGAGNIVGGIAPDPSAPSPLAAGTVSVAPVFLANYNAAGGQVWLDHIGIEKVEDLSALPSRPWLVGDFQRRGQIVIHLGRSWIARIDNTGVTPPSTGTGTATWGLLADRGTDGAAGSTGATGAPGITQGPVSPMQVPVTADGILKPGSLPQTRQMVLLQAASNVTTSATWSIAVAPAGLTLSVSTAGLVTVTGLTVESATATVRGVLSGANYDFPLPVARVRDAPSAISVSGTLGFPGSTSLTVLGTTPDMALPGGRPATVSMSMLFEATNPISVDVLIEFSSNSGGTWTQMGLTATASAMPGEPGALSVGRTLASHADPRLVRFRARGSCTSPPDLVGTNISALIASSQ